jgi:hypothetical protein
VSSRHFYRDLKGFTDFSRVTADEYFAEVPDDWSVVLTDVKESTRAIEAGRYKDVNTVGASSIVSAHNAMGTLLFPYTFGGDGATFVVPADFLSEVATELAGLQEISRTRFELELRAGAVGVDSIRKAGANVEVAKFLLAGNRHMAMFRGGGLSLAERLIKADPDRCAMPESAAQVTDLRRLSCRWKPIPASHGISLSLLVVGRGANTASVYDRVLSRLDDVFGGQLEKGNPVHLPAMSYAGIGDCVRHEKRLHPSTASLKWMHRIGEILMAVLVFKFGLHPLLFSPTRYAKSLATHSDYRKFDDMLRMVVDCTQEQAGLIREFLDEAYRDSQLFYGLHESDNSLMTCFVDWVDEGNHVHFIDGGDGGYAMAAKELHAQVDGSG